MIPQGSQGIGHLVTRIAQDLIPRPRDAYMVTPTWACSPA